VAVQNLIFGKDLNESIGSSVVQVQGQMAFMCTVL
jgi:hypothetical protein